MDMSMGINTMKDTKNIDTGKNINKKRKIMYYYPGKKFPAISVTGPHCDIMCPHCQGHYLKSMIWTDTPDELVATCKILEDKGVMGCLISGGCTMSGSVPVPYEALHTIREETELLLNVHTGLFTDTIIPELEKLDPYISFDLPTPTVIHELYHLDKTQNDYFAALKSIIHLKVVPHVMVGLNLLEEIKTIKTLHYMGISSLVIIVFTPTKGTPFNTIPVSVDNVLKPIKVARSLFCELILGCMRPRIKELEEQVPLFDGVVAPTPWAKNAVEKAGIPVGVQETCCVIP
ncbi:MAG: hypothetical protein PVF58_21055 [Candidatus Methanofastidiosia archaeon]|jgi:hypothetical protein